MPPATLAAVQANVFTPSCASFSTCHQGPSAPRGLDLTEGAAYASVVNVDAVEAGWKRVVPRDPDGSLLLAVLLEPVGAVRQMPPGFPLDDSMRSLVRTWILSGAPDESSTTSSMVAPGPQVPQPE